MGVIPNITEEDKKAIRDHMEATLQANLRDAKQKAEEAERVASLANREFQMAWFAWTSFMQSKLSS